MVPRGKHSLINTAEISAVVQVVETGQTILNPGQLIDVALALRTLSGGAPLADIVQTVAVQLEREMIDQVLVLSQGNKSEAARRLKIDYKTLCRKLKKYADIPAGAASGLHESK